MSAIFKDCRITAFLILTTFGALTACTTAPDDPVPEDGVLVITTQTATVIEGALGDAVALRFRSVEHEPRKVDVTIYVDNVTLVTRIDEVVGEVSFDAKSAQLSPAQIGGLERLIAALKVSFPGDVAPSNAEAALGRVLNYVSVAPASTTLPTLTAVAETGWIHLSCTCSWQYIGSGWNAMAGKGETCGSSGAPHCPGRCGVGCGPDNLKFPWAWGSGTYTQDCALHDYGLGSWGNALDDYTLSAYNCG